MAICACSPTRLPSAPGRIASTAVWTIGATCSGCKSRRTLPATIRDTSSRSSISLACVRAFRSMTSSASVRRSWRTLPERSIVIHPSIALSGVRSSCDSVARNSSLARSASCAAARASRSRVTSRRSRSPVSRCASSDARSSAAWRAVASHASTGSAMIAEEREREQHPAEQHGRAEPQRGPSKCGRASNTIVHCRPATSTCAIARSGSNGDGTTTKAAAASRAAARMDPRACRRRRGSQVPRRAEDAAQEIVAAKRRCTRTRRANGGVPRRSRVIVGVR